mgnify:FL=1
MAISELPAHVLKVAANKIAQGKTIEEVRERIPALSPEISTNKSGSPKFNDIKISKMVGDMARAIEERSKAHGKSDEYKACYKAMEVLDASWKRWLKASV